LKQLSYTLSAERLQEGGRLAPYVIWSRLNADGKDACGSYISAMGLTFDEVWSIARRTCGEDRTFILPKMPILEIIFRLLIVAPTDIVPADRLHEMLSNALTPSHNHISYDVMVRILSSAASYGIVALQGEEDRRR
jgi:hypothetical protein